MLKKDHPPTLEEKKTDVILEKRGVRPTPIRELVYTEMAETAEALSMTDLEDRLRTIDKSTISRTLHTFREAGIVHKVTDEFGVARYALSAHNSRGEALECPAHFYCTHCTKICCLEGQTLPRLSLPKDFEAEEINIVVRGSCPECKASKR